MKAICVLLRLLVSVPLGNRGRDYSLAPQAIRTLGTRGGVINCFLFLFRISRSRSALVCLFFFSLRGEFRRFPNFPAGRRYCDYLSISVSIALTSLFLFALSLPVSCASLCYHFFYPPIISVSIFLFVSCAFAISSASCGGLRCQYP